MCCTRSIAARRACCGKRACRTARNSPSTTSAGWSTAWSGRGWSSGANAREDGRSNVLVITAKGRDLRRKMWPVYAAGIEEHFGARLTAEEAQQLAGLLAKLVAT